MLNNKLFSLRTLLILLIGIGIGLWASYLKDSWNEQSAQTFAENSIQNLFNNKEEVNQFILPEAKAQITQEIEKLQTLGALQNYQHKRTDSQLNKALERHALNQGTAEFENGSAIIALSLIQVDNQWFIKDMTIIEQEEE